MKKFIATVSFSAPIEETLIAISDAGFDGVELLFQDIEQCDGSPKKLGELCVQLGLDVVALQPLRDFEGSPQFEDKLEEAKRAFETMNQVGTDLTVLCSNVSPDLVFEPNLWIDHLQVLSELAEKMEARIAFEALSWGTFINRFEAASAIVNRVDHPAFGLALDSFHTYALTNDCSRLSELAPHKIFLTQLADAPKLGGDLLNWSRHHRCFPGNGEFDVNHFIGRVSRLGYEGPYSLEVFSRSLRAQPAVTVANNGMAAFNKLEDAVHRTTVRMKDEQRLLSAG